MKRIFNAKGLSLIELLIILALLGIVLSGITALLFNSMDMYSRNDSQWQVQQDARYAERLISNDIRSAYIIDSPSDNCTGNILSLNDGDIVIKCGTGVNENTLYRISGGVSDPIIYSADSVLFSRAGYTITLTITANISGNTFVVNTKLFSRAIH